MKKENRPDEQGNPKKTKQSYSNTSRSQRQRILKHFHENPQLSTIEAREQYGILHPCGRVMELRRKGHRIDTHWISAPDTNGVPHRVGLYVYQGDNGDDHAI
jgi:hypothetical protein